MRLCPICSSDRRDLLYKTPTGQEILSCVDCGFVFSDNTPIVDYAAHSMYICAATYPPKTEHYERIVQNCLDSGITRNASVLDVGCALGNQMQKFLEAGFASVSGISISPEEVEQCRSRGLEAGVQNVEDHPVGHRQFDLVILSHVLEHIPEPVPFLRALRRWVKPTGSLYVEVPNAIHYADYFTSICQGYNNEHINHFDDGHLADALVRSGFQACVWDSYIAHDGHPYPCTWRLATRVTHGPQLRVAIERYTDRLNIQMEQVHTAIWRNGLDSHRGRVAIWGAGQTAHLLLSGILGSYPIAAATDTNPAYHGQSLRDCIIVSPEEFHPDSDTPIVVCSQLSQKAIVNRIKELGLTNRLITLEGGE